MSGGFDFTRGGAVEAVESAGRQLRDSGLAPQVPERLRTPPEPGRGAPGGQAIVADRYVEDRQRKIDQAQFALSFHLGGSASGFSRNLVRPLAEKWVDTIGTDEPAALRLLDEDVNWIAALTDDDVKNLALSGGTLTPNSGDLFTGFAEVALEAGAFGAWQQAVLQAEDSAKGNWQKITAADMEEAFAQAIGSRVTSTDDALLAAAQESQAEVATVEGAYGLVHLRDKPAVWQQKGDNLAIAFTGEEGDVTNFGLRLDPGTKIGSTADAVQALIAAKNGWAHEALVEGFADDRPVFGEVTAQVAQVIRQGMDVTENIAVRTIAALGRQPLTADMINEREEAAEEILAAQKAQQSVELERALERGQPIREELEAQLLNQAIVDISVQIRDEMNKGAFVGPDLPPLGSGEEVILAAGEYRSLTETLLEENPDLVDIAQLGDDARDVLLKYAEESPDPPTEIGLFIEGVANDIFTAAEAWDGIAQTLGVNTIDFLNDTGILAPFTGLLAPENEDGKAEAYEQFSNTFADILKAPESKNVAEYFGLEGTAADAALLATGITFDPLNVLFGGPGLVRKLGMKAATNPGFAKFWARLPGPRRVIDVLASSNTTNAVRMAAALDGLTTDQRRIIMKLALDPDSPREAVEQALIDALPSTDGAGFLSIGAIDRVRTRTIGDMVAQTVDRLGRGNVSEETLTRMVDTLGKLSRETRISLSGESFSDEFLDMVVQTFPNDPDKVVSWSERMLQAMDEVGTLRDESLILYRMRLERAQKALADASVAGDDVLKGLGRQVEVAQSQADEAAEAALRASKKKTGPRQKALHTQAELERIQARKVEIVEARKAKVAEAQQELWEAERAYNMVVEAETNARTARVVAEYYDELGEELGLTVTGRNQIWNDLREYDWSEVHGRKGRKTLQPTQQRAPAMGHSKMLDTFGPPGSKVRVDAETAGMFNRQSTMQLPATPYEIAIYRGLKDKPDLLAKYKLQVARNAAIGIHRAYRSVFAANLLWNFFTPMITNFDEVSRFAAVTGWRGLAGTARSAVAPVPWLGRAAAGKADSYAAQYMRDMLGSLGAGNRGWTWVERPTGRMARAVESGIAGADNTLGAFKSQVERFLNGMLTRDDVFREYAISVLDEPIKYVDEAEEAGWYLNRRATASGRFRRWWDEGFEPEDFVDEAAEAQFVAVPGKVNQRKHLLGKEGMQEIDADQAFASVDASFNYWLDNFVEPGQRARVRQRLLEAAARGERLTREADGSVLGAVLRVPGVPSVTQATKEALGGKGGASAAVRWFWEQMYGIPGQRRGSVFFEHFFDEEYRMLRAAYEQKGTLLTPQRLADVTDLPVEEAAVILKRGVDDPRLRPLLRGGYVTDDTLRSVAARRAMKQSDDLMYRFEASTLWGEKAEVLMPFARAQADFLRWWGLHLTKPPLLRVGRGGLTSRVADVPGFRQVFEALQQVERLPINLRAAGRYAHLAAVYNNEYEDSAIDWTLDSFTFFPLKNSGDIIMDILPTPNGLVTWLSLNALEAAGAEDLQKGMEELWPAWEYSNGDFWDLIMPTSERSLRNVLGAGIRAVDAVIGDKEVTPGSTLMARIGAALSDVALPPNLSSFETAWMVDFLRSDTARSMGPDPAGPGGDEVAIGARVAYDQAMDKNWRETLKGQFKLSNLRGEAEYVEAYRGLVGDWLPVLSQFDLVPSSMMYDDGEGPRLPTIWGKWDRGEDLTRDEERFLTDSLSSLNIALGEAEFPGYPGLTWRDVIMAEDPGLAAVSVSKLWIPESLLDSENDEAREFAREHRGSGGRMVRVPPGQDGAELRQDALGKGWATKRPMVGNAEDPGWAMDAWGFAEAAQRRILKSVWEKVTGREWNGNQSRDPETRERGPGIAKAIRDAQVQLSPMSRRLLGFAGLEIPEGMEITTQEWADMIDVRLGQLNAGPMELQDALRNSRAAASFMDDPVGQQILDQVGDMRDMYKQRGVDDFEKWEPSHQEMVRQALVSGIDAGWISKEQYDNDWAPVFGEADWEPPVPPAVEDLERGIVIGPNDLDKVTVIDGDTIGLVLPGDQALRFRIIGVNAPESGSEGGAEAAAQMERLIRQAGEITLGFYKPGMFGTVQQSGPNEQRLIGWMYVNRVPIFDENVFTATNPTGAGFGGDQVTDLVKLYQEKGGALADPAESGVS